MPIHPGRRNLEAVEGPFSSFENRSSGAGLSSSPVYFVSSCCYPTRLVRCQKHYQLRYLFGLTNPSKWMCFLRMLQECLVFFFAHSATPVQTRDDDTRVYSINTNSLWR